VKSKVTEQGVIVPKEFLEDVEEVEIRKQEGVVLVVPIGPHDPIARLGSEPIASDVSDASEKHDRYLYGTGR
jgi:virulence-associated protein VagC